MVSSGRRRRGLSHSEQSVLGTHHQTVSPSHHVAPDSHRVSGFDDLGVRGSTGLSKRQPNLRATLDPSGDFETRPRRATRKACSQRCRDPSSPPRSFRIGFNPQFAGSGLSPGRLELTAFTWHDGPSGWRSGPEAYFMIEPIMYVGLGFLAASLLALVTIPWSTPARSG
jgi:hypothetical protein